jgi:hypothetical protein
MPDIMTEPELAELRALVDNNWEMYGHAIARVHLAVPRLLATVEAMRDAARGQIAVIEAARQMQAQAERVRDEAQAETARLLVIETYTKKE